MTLADGSIIPNVAKIAVLRANGLGDLIVALPALEALRAVYSDAEIVLLGTAMHAALLHGRPGPVDRVVVVPPSRGVNGDADTVEESAALDAFFAETARERFDLALQLHGGGRNSNPFLLRLGARVTAGLRTPDAVPLDRCLPYVYFQPEIFRYLEAVALVGARPVGFSPRLALIASDLAEAEAVVPEAGRPLVALHPGATDPRRRWPPAKFAAVGDRLAAAGARVVVTGTPNERPLVDAMRTAMRADAADLCGRLSLGGLAGLLSRCRVVVSNDSGPMHLAYAVGAPTVGIFWGMNLGNYGPLTRARFRPVVSWRMACPVCGAVQPGPDCGHRESIVADITVEEVAGHACDL
ncbi:MAG TPA: glycosyltransferase family 9 protein, partial [Thermomicrobiales bacterium]|nr:glycosyltransferase family 9 protein [Thermomicrobiales bacterium]